MLELINKYNNVIDKIEEIFKTSNLEIKDYVDYGDGISFIIQISDYCTLDIYTCEDEIKIYIDNINTSTYYQVHEIRQMLEDIEKLSLQLSKKIVDKLNYLG